VHDDDRSKSEAPHEGQLPADSSELRHAPAIGASEYPELAQPKVHRQNRAELDEHEKGPVFRVECGECDETPPLPEDIDVEEVVTESNGASTTARTEVALLKARHVAFHVLKLNSGWVFMQYCVRRLHSRRWQLCVAAMLSAPVLAAMLVISPLWAVWIWSTDDVEFADAFWWALGRISWGRLSLPPTIDTHGASTSVPQPVVLRMASPHLVEGYSRVLMGNHGVALRMASPHLVVLLTVVDCATVRQSCSCGALFATRQQPAVGSVHRDRLADSAGARCDRWPRNYRRKLSSGLLCSARPRLGSARPIHGYLIYRAHMATVAAAALGCELVGAMCCRRARDADWLPTKSSPQSRRPIRRSSRYRHNVRRIAPPNTCRCEGFEAGSTPLQLLRCVQC
jgi:hypothetical protein